MNGAGKKAELEIYPPFGTSPREGHTLGYFGASVWADDVFHFLDDNCVRDGAREGNGG